MKTCDSCKYWKTPVKHPKFLNRAYLGNCTWNQYACDGENENNTKFYEAYGFDGAYGAVVTGPDFGCVLHDEEKGRIV